MNFNLNLWDKTEAKEFGEFEVLELGGHETKIISAEEYKSDLTGNLSLKVCVDISGTDKQKGYFTNQYINNNNPDKKWPASATRYLSLKDENLGYLKGFITALENSNAGFKFNTKGDWSQLKGLKIASVFGLEEYQKEDKTTGFRTRLNQFRSLDKLKSITIPDVKMLNGTYLDYEEYKEMKNGGEFNNTASTKTNKSEENLIEITDDFLD